MEKVVSDKASKKVALFYHPLFQNTIKAWSASFTIGTEATLNMLTFIELNLRIQKVMISPFDFKSSLNSALTDWYRELDEIHNKQNDATNKPAMPRIHKPTNYQHVIKTFESLPFDLSLSKDKYTQYLKNSKNHIGFTYSQAIISVIGFAKFLFDLCTSWCDEMDIELFVYFINGIFLQMVQGESLSKAAIKKLDSTENWPENFLKFFKKEKSQYQRYIKKDLLAIQPWYEWNYFRIEQMQVKFTEQFSAIFPSSKGLIEELAKIFESTREGMPNPRDIQNFDLQVLGTFIPEIDNYCKNLYKDKESKENDRQDDGLILFKVEDKSSMGKHTHTRVVKKCAFPILGKSYPKPKPPEPGEKVVKTIDAASFFINEPEDDQELDQIDETSAPNQSLYPIWENILSESNSNSTINSKTALNFSNKLQRRSSAQKKKMLIPDISQDQNNIQYTFGGKDNSRLELESSQHKGVFNLPNGCYEGDASPIDHVNYSNIDFTSSYLDNPNEDLNLSLFQGNPVQQDRRHPDSFQQGLGTDLFNPSLNVSGRPKIKRNSNLGQVKFGNKEESSSKKSSSSRARSMGKSNDEYIIQINNYSKVGPILPILRTKENNFEPSIFSHKFALNNTQAPHSQNHEITDFTQLDPYLSNMYQPNLEEHDITNTSDSIATYNEAQQVYPRAEQFNPYDQIIGNIYDSKKRKGMLPGLNSKRYAMELERRDFFDKIGSIMIEQRKYIDLRKDYAMFTRPRENRGSSLPKKGK